MKHTLTFAALMTLGAAALAPLPSQAQNFSLVISNAPPAPRFETVPPARHGYVWAPGYWRWDGRRHVWVGGTWIRARPGYRYVQPRWERGPRGDWHMRPYRWDR